MLVQYLLSKELHFACKGVALLSHLWQLLK
jgi:hypothetical protein